MNKFINCQLATIPGRINTLPDVIDSLIDQVDKLNIILNGFSFTERYHIEKLYDYDQSAWGIEDLDKLNFIPRDNQMADGEKHYRIEEAEPGYIFTADDDIIYPDFYVKYMISKIEQYNRKYVVTLHGRVYNELPIYSYYRDRAEMYQCLATVKGDHVILDDTKAGCGGDGVMAYHTDTFRMHYEWCELPSMSQLWVALACNKLGVPQMVVEHESDWLIYTLDETFDTIWDRENQNDGVQTNLINTRWIKR